MEILDIKAHGFKMRMGMFNRDLWDIARCLERAARGSGGVDTMGRIKRH